MDTACVELRYTDGMIISINCTEVEYEVAHTVKQRAALDYLVYLNGLGSEPTRSFSLPKASWGIPGGKAARG